MSTRKQVTKKLANSNRLGNEKAKSLILDELVHLTGWHRYYSRAALRVALKQPKPCLVRSGRKPIYPADLQPGVAPVLVANTSVQEEVSTRWITDCRWLFNFGELAAYVATVFAIALLARTIMSLKSPVGGAAQGTADLRQSYARTFPIQ